LLHGPKAPDGILGHSNLRSTSLDGVASVYAEVTTGGIWTDGGATVPFVKSGVVSRASKRPCDGGGAGGCSGMGKDRNMRPSTPWVPVGAAYAALSSNMGGGESGMIVSSGFLGGSGDGKNNSYAVFLASVAL
jgi:hypothetical protein